MPPGRGAGLRPGRRPRRPFRPNALSALNSSAAPTANSAPNASAGSRKPPTTTAIGDHTGPAECYVHGPEATVASLGPRNSSTSVRDQPPKQAAKRPSLHDVEPSETPASSLNSKGPASGEGRPRDSVVRPNPHGINDLLCCQTAQTPTHRPILFDFLAVRFKPVPAEPAVRPRRPLFAAWSA
jgi:hypothetical protein